MTAIAITANTSWYLYNFRKNTIKNLINNGYVVFAFAPWDEYSQRLEELGCSFINISIDQGGTNPVNDLKTLYYFHSALKEFNIKCALNFTPKNNIYCTLAASFLKIKTINNIAGLGFLFINNSFSSKIARVLYKVSQRKADKIFFQNEDDRKLFIDNKIANVHLTDRLPGSGVDLTRFNVTSSPDDGTVRFLLIARMLYDKGVGHYIDAARILKNKYGQKIEFNLLGFLDVNNPSSISKQQMQKWVSEGIVNYLGVSDSVENEIANADCVVLPSFYREGVPKSLLESAAMGKPLITTDNVGCRETVVDGVNGFLCIPRSTESLLDKLESMYSMTHPERLVMGLASREKIEREFNEKIVIDKYLEAISTVLND